MKDLEEEVLRKLLVELFLAAPRKRSTLPRPASQEGTKGKTATTNCQSSDNQPGETRDEKEAKA